MSKDIERRCDTQQQCKAELKIGEAMAVVEAMPANEKLSIASSHLVDAMRAVADYVDGVE